jgi:FtsZ-interacting cell division protein ZipA
MELQIISIVVAIVALIVSTWSWRRSRNIYGIEHHAYYFSDDNYPKNKELKEKLDSGNYTVLHTNLDGSYILVTLGQIKK